MSIPQLDRDGTSDKVAFLGGLPERDLVALTVQGSAVAFREVMRRYNRRLFRTARSILRDDTEAEDVVQETYVRAFQWLAGFRGEASLATWLTRITLNEAFGRLRRRRITVDLKEIESAQVEMTGAHILMFPGTQPNSNPEDAAGAREIRQLLSQAIDELPEAFRVVLVMRDVDGMSIEETADVLGIRSETVRTRLHRARERLRVGLEAKLGPTLREVFPFEGARCARLADRVIERLGLEKANPAT